MAGICFFFEHPDVDVWSGKDLDAWHYAARIAGDIDRMMVVNKTGMVLESPDRALDFQVVGALPILPNACFLTTPKERFHPEQPLWDYDHRADWYVFGPASGWTGNLPSMDGEHVVYIPQSGFAHCHSVHVATAVMFHRYHVRNS